MSDRLKVLAQYLLPKQPLTRFAGRIADAEHGVLTQRLIGMFVSRYAVDMAEAENPAHREEEVGDLLFACANLARHLGVDPEVALRRANAKFERRFRGVEDALAARGRTPAESDLAEMDALWGEVKTRERVSD